MLRRVLDTIPSVERVEDDAQDQKYHLECYTSRIEMIGLPLYGSAHRLRPFCEYGVDCVPLGNCLPLGFFDR